MKPLEGVKILDFTQAHAGSLATMILADFGAEVIKIERAGVGDLARYWEPFKDENSGYYAFLNRNKKSISLNAASNEGKEIIYRLVKEVDVVCENFKYGSMEKMGFDYEVLKEYNPQIIYASLNGFGNTGPLKKNIGLDLQLQAMSGVMDRTGKVDGPPTRVGAAFGDHISGTYMASAIILALINKRKTGEGQKIDISILDSLFSLLEANVAQYSINKEVPKRTGNWYPSIAPYDTFKTNDGYVTISVSTEKQWKNFCEALDLKEMLENKDYVTNELRDKNYNSSLKGELEELFKQMSKFEIESILSNAGISSGAVRSVGETMNMKQIKDREMLLSVDDKKLGKIQIPGMPIKLNKKPATIDNPAPLMGEDTEKYLKDLGYNDVEISLMSDNKIIEIV